MKASRTVLLLAVLTATACGNGSTGNGSTQPASRQLPPSTPVTVVIQNFAFNPNPVTLHAGQTVVWHFDDGSIPHNVTGDGWASPNQSSGDYAHTFVAPGTYEYHCTIHKGMDGQIVVQAAVGQPQ